MTETTRVFFATLAEFDAMMHWIRENLGAVLSDQAAAKRFELAIEEAVVNIIKYAYIHPSGFIEIAFRFDEAAQKVSVILKDEGIPFNPLTRQLPTTNPKEEVIEEGGLGILFMRKMSDFIVYERVNNSNVLVLTKNL